MTERSCKTCKHAEWVRTPSGRPASNGAGLCMAPTPFDDLSLWPKALPWYVRSALLTRPSGGINRNYPYEECPLWKRR
jgi:hypothetical protein